ncbi:hypothetical protein [Hymenobacter canadensis]|uniref:Uncharacterized protein n=1 Tax=Hymenobacter canadensis TaxID=2999067 RepID=A0ABY7LVL3_9BACT|nr:hypothetical protein [Hymenobacter canadensis]WBA43934.1 hypothetical protein O3303_20420 [Hymenobacter canadensis]
MLFCGVALGLYALVPGATSAGGQVGRAAMLMSGGISGLLALVTLLPMHVGGFYSDGARVRNLWRNGPAGQLEVAVLSAMVPLMASTRPRELSRQLLDRAAGLPGCRRSCRSSCTCFTISTS